MMCSELESAIQNLRRRAEAAWDEWVENRSWRPDPIIEKLEKQMEPTKPGLISYGIEYEADIRRCGDLARDGYQWVIGLTFASRADAEAKLRAINATDDLLAACEAAHQDVENLLNLVRRYRDDADGDTRIASSVRRLAYVSLHKRADQLEAAIAKAKEMKG